MNTYRQLPKRHPAIKKTYPTCSFQQAQSIIEKRCGNVAISERHLSEHKQSAPNKVIILFQGSMDTENKTGGTTINICWNFAVRVCVCVHL